MGSTTTARKRRIHGEGRRRGRVETLEERRVLADTASLIADHFVVVQNSPAVALDILANDQFTSSYTGARQITAVSYGSEGGRVAIVNQGRALTYTPAADFSGQERFSYFVDGEFSTTVTIDVQSPLRPDEFTLYPDGQSHPLMVLDNDPFWQNYAGERRITALSVTSGESEVRLADDGRSVLFQPAATAQGKEQFVYVVDGKYSTTVEVQIPEVLSPDEFEMLQNGGKQIWAVQSNDLLWPSYPGERKVTQVVPVNSASTATVAVVPEGRGIEYTPGPDFSGWEQLRYVIDQRFETTVSVYVNRPTQPDWFQVDQDSRDFRVDVVQNDTYWSPLRRQMLDAVQRVTAVEPSTEGGTVRVGTDGVSVVYTPPAGFTGQDRFRYVADGRYPSEVNVTVSRPVRDDVLTVYQDVARQPLPVFTNDFLGNGYQGPRAITGVTTTEQGVEVTLSDNLLRYTPPAGFVGRDRFSYTVDGSLNASVTVDVLPLAQPDYQSVCSTPNQSIRLNPLANDFFQAGYAGPARITSARLVQGNGNVSVLADGRTVLYAQMTSQWATIEYVVDGKYSATATVSRSSHLSDDQYVVDQNSASQVLSLLANDFQNRWQECSSADYRGPRRITAVRGSEQGGQLTVSADGLQVSYTPPADFFGEDRFTYVVDDSLEATVRVNVVRRVLDDAYRVAAGTSRSLSVLVNDLFGAEYAGPRRITAVTESQAGGSVSIAPDGKSLIYRAPEQFAAPDTLEYTVDGRLKARVTIAPVQASPFERFGTMSSLQEFLLDDALVRYDALFGQPQYRWMFEVGLDAAVTDSAVPRDHSETNVQVAGVDEGDIVEFDDSFVYMLTGNDLVIVSAWPAEELAEVGRYAIPGTATAMYLHGDRLTVISELAVWPEGTDPNKPLRPDIAGASLVADMAADWFWYPQPLRYDTLVTVLDVTNRSQPTRVQESRLEGKYLQSRGLGDFVYVTVVNQAVAPEPKVLYPEDGQAESGQRGVYETREQYLARVRQDLGQFIADSMPSYASSGPDGQLVRSGLLHEPEDLYRPLAAGATNLVSLVSVNVTQSEPGLASATGVYTSGATEVYASLEHFYVMESGWEQEIGAVTRILQFDWDGVAGTAHFVAQGSVPGTMLNQFSADEYQGDLRIVTTVGHQGAGNWSNRTENDLFVLREHGGLLEFVGSLQQVGLGETARSVRFLGSRAFLVTFRNVDPLFALDLTDPVQPTIAGHVTLPGFSSYAHMIDDHHLLTIGRNTPNGFAGPVQVSLFDVSDLADPRRIDEHTFARFSESEAATDHHAFGYFARHNRLAIPTSRSFIVRRDVDGDGYAESREWQTEYGLAVFRVDVSAASGNPLELLEEILQPSPLRRSGYIEDRLYAIAEDSVKVVDIVQPSLAVAEVAGLRPVVDGDPPVVPLVDPPLWDLAESALTRTRADLASRLGISSGAILPVIAEEHGDAWDTVVRVGDTYYRYAVADTETVLLDDQFQFPTASGTAASQNPLNPLDVNGDGHVAPNDALRLLQLLEGGDTLATQQPVLRQIGSASGDMPMFGDVNGDKHVSPMDVLLIINEVNRNSRVSIDTGNLAVTDPESLADPAAIDQFFASIRQTAGDANLDGVFNSADLVLIFQRGHYEDGRRGVATWEDGDWDGDRMVSTADLVLAFAQGNYRKDARAAE